MARSISTLVDELDFYADTRDVGAVLTVTATSTGTQNGVDTSNTGTGALFYVAFTSVVATATVRVNIQAKDPVSGLYITFASLSLDNVSVTTTANALSALYVYPGAFAAGGNAAGLGGIGVNGVSMPRVFRVQASITVINATATSAVAMTVGMTRLGAI